MLNKVKATVDTFASMRIFNAIQYEICRLQPINEFLNNFIPILCKISEFKDMDNNEESIKFSPVIIGTMRLGEWGVKMSSNALERFIDQCIELGVTDFDHADIYGHYSSEGEFGAVLKRRADLRQKIQNTTKCGIKLTTKRRPDFKIKSYDSTKAHILASAENSLKELGVETLDLLLIHRPDYLMNPHEIAEAFQQLKKEGKAKYFGVSNFTASQFDLLNSFISLKTNQLEVSILERSAFENGTLDQCIKNGIAPTAWSPLAGGSLFCAAVSSVKSRVLLVAEELQKKYNATLDQILLAFLRKHPSGIIPVLGTSKIERIKSALDSQKINLTHEEWYELWQAAIGEEVA